MIDHHENEDPEFASPACLMHEVDPVYMGLGSEYRDISAWRRGERRRLIEMRALTPLAEREERTRALCRRLDDVLPPDLRKTISLFWPLRDEPDLRTWMSSLRDRGATCLLPVVIQKNCPLVFRRWQQGDLLERGFFNIPVPVRGEEHLPEIVIAPVIGFDSGCYRLGSGGGYFDRTLAAFSSRPLVIGIGYEFQRVESIHPQAHDIPMDLIITDQSSMVREEPRSLLSGHHKCEA
ncbi:MAG: 5-formyltetrahydrofolate cyclo-ligase [Alphaproteobacteria bacterium]|nr:5-formyltetrahydrofolate cyclo-ligase [Alphaproteobacteria bacterium]MBU1552737.1 5-formyltetrahydrofolate cyclo-ligase [Alphaproteobacteria bacterium]MBU2337599.1 5-formyltetrahydrofolate cyclo-ligase [Alphaproteobacteria bacterium]MBU2387261.1 5-formyltetrahydrofolate cyclo-ligase [Alphaproteobacteria bacterium]